MSRSIKNISLADYYFGLLHNLNTEIKLDLISKLSLSIKHLEKENTVTLDSLYGSFKSDETAEELINKIRDSRTFNRNIEPL